MAGTCQRKFGPSATANRIDDAACLAFIEPPIVVDLDRRKHQRESRETFEDVVPDGLADLSRGARVVEDIVRDLKCKSQRAAVPSQSRPLFRFQTPPHPPHLAAP